MICVSRLNKKYDSQKVLNDVSFSLPRFGFIALVGSSGSGKSTLLNCIAGLTDYEGDINVDGVSLSTLNKEDRDYFRLKKLGFVFQDFKLFELETIKQNILLPLEILKEVEKEKKDDKARDLLKVVDLDISADTRVDKLSGGEKQRVAIARSLVNNPAIILADEPTGNLDTENSEKIMEILSKISTTSLVIMVSHDELLARTYADQIITIENGKVYQNELSRKRTHKEYLPVIKSGFDKLKSKLPLSFLLRHAYQYIKEKKWRTLLSNIVTSLGLVGIGLSTILSSSIASNMKEAYSSFFDNNQIVISNRNTIKTSPIKMSATEEEINIIKDNNKDLIKYVSAYYTADFESFFINQNSLDFSVNSFEYEIPNYSARTINDFQILSKNEKTYPSFTGDLKNNEIILGLTIKNVENICYHLGISRTVSALEEYLKKEKFSVRFSFANDSWSYSDEQLFDVKAFSLETRSKIYHTNPKWNEYVFEESMRFPITYDHSSLPAYPWMMKKSYIVHPNDEEDFLKATKTNQELSKYLFEKHNNSYICYKNNSEEISCYYDHFFQDVSEDISHPLFSTNKGIISIPESLLSGFANDTFFSSDYTLLEKVVDENSVIFLENNETLMLPEGILHGTYTKSKSKTMSFVSDINTFKYGSEPFSYDEIAISTAAAEALFSKENPLFEYLFLANNNVTNISASGKMYKQFKIVPLKITGIFDSDRYEISHNSLWPILFFQEKLDISIFDLTVNSISYQVSETKNIDKAVNLLNNNFSYFKASYPFENINKSVDELSSTITIITLVMALVASIISIILITLTIKLFLYDNSKDIELAELIGIGEKEARKFLYSHSFLLCFISLLFSLFEVMFISVFINYGLSKSLGTSFVFIFRIDSLIYMSVLAVLITIISSFLMNLSLKKRKLKI